jgi:predicted amidohydrolase
VHQETTFLAAARLAQLPVFETPAGKLGVLICADSWYPEAYVPLAVQNVDLLVVPNNQGGWHKPWPGYATEHVPADVDPQDVLHLTEKEAWLKYALAGRMHTTSATIGLHVFLHGRIWDQTGDGQTIIVRKAEVITAPYVSGAALVNVWLD